MTSIQEKGLWNLTSITSQLILKLLLNFQHLLTFINLLLKLSNWIFLSIYFQSEIFDEIDLSNLCFAECSTKNINHSFQVSAHHFNGINRFMMMEKIERVNERDSLKDNEQNQLVTPILYNGELLPDIS